MIARYEVTFGEWIEFLRALPAKERKKHMPTILREVSGELVLQYRDQRRRPGEPFIHQHRTRNQTSDWLRWPVVGIGWQSAREYAAWLARTKVDGARLCDEREWEKAARGADGRPFPHGNRLLPADANHWWTYEANDDRQIQDMKNPPPALDEVGRFSASRSPYGVEDMAGNAWEWTAFPATKSRPDTRVSRSGAWEHDADYSFTTNRGVGSYYFVFDEGSGVRICAS
jgi:eukaryotic-like serine/threonine-protein kinase